jgi:hypothetical protein
MGNAGNVADALEKLAGLREGTMSTSSMEPHIDFTRIDFPTDKLTIKDLRKTDPYAFDVRSGVAPHPFQRPTHARHWRRPLSFASLDEAIGITLDSERFLADKAFRTVLRLPKRDEERFNVRNREGLAEMYVEFGVASDEHEAQGMLRRIEAQAVAQARQHRGQRGRAR